MDHLTCQLAPVGLQRFLFGFPEGSPSLLARQRGPLDSLGPLPDDPVLNVRLSERNEGRV
jgi:hypothetical protein